MNEAASMPLAVMCWRRTVAWSDIPSSVNTSLMLVPSVLKEVFKDIRRTQSQLQRDKK